MINGVWFGYIGIVVLLILSVAFYRNGVRGKNKKWEFLGLGGTLCAIVASLVLALTQQSQPRMESSMGNSEARPDAVSEEIQKLEKGLTHAPDNVVSMARLAHLELKMQNFEKVAELSQRILTLEPKHVETFAHMGMLHFAMGQFKPALHFFDEALKLDPKNAETLLFQRMVASQGSAKK